MSQAAIPADGRQLTDRQQREAEYYDQYSQLNAVERVGLRPVLSDERRPWSPYWSLCRLVRDAYRGPEQRILDFGCGMGAASVAYAAIGYQVEGFDISEGNIGVAARVTEREGVADRCRFSCMAAEQLAYPSEHFDVLVGVDILHHLEIDRALAEAARVLKSGGVAIFKEPVRAPLLDRLRELPVILSIAPRESTLDKHVHITEDERKLTGDDIRLIRKYFEIERIEKFSLFQRLYRLLPQRWFNLVCRLQKLDYLLMKRIPFLKHFGDVAIFVCRKK